MDTITYDFSRLDLDGLLELQHLQRKMRDATGSIEGYSALNVDELLRLEDLHYRMAGLVNPRKPPAPYVSVISPEFTSSSGVTAALEPVAIAPAAAPAKPADPVTPAQPEKLKRPQEDIVSAHRALDALMRFGA